MAAALHALTRTECEELLRSRDVGRMAVSTPQGPHIVPVGYVVVDAEPGPAVVARIGAYSVLGSYGAGSMLAFEVDDLESAYATWSVVVRGRGEVLRRYADLGDAGPMPRDWAAQPWASGPRGLLLRLRLGDVSGRRLENLGRSSRSALPGVVRRPDPEGSRRTTQTDPCRTNEPDRS